MSEDPFLDKLSDELRQLMGQKSAIELTEEVLSKHEWMDEETLRAAILLGNALKPDFEEMDAAFHKYMLPDLERVVAEKVAGMSLEELESVRSKHE